jgi:hypothetical protein
VEVPEGAGACYQCGAAISADALSTVEAWRRRRAALAAAFRETLAGLASVSVQVEPVNADVQRDGLAASDLRLEVESALRKAGISVVTPAGLIARVPGTPFLQLDVMTIRLDTRYANSLRLELWQGVKLIREPNIITLAVTWAGAQLVGTIAADRAADIRQAVRAATDEFVDAWRTAVSDARLGQRVPDDRGGTAGS